MDGRDKTIKESNSQVKAKAMLSPDKNRVVSEMKTLSFSAHRAVYLIPIEGTELKFEELCKAWWRFRWTDSMISIYGEPDISTRFERHTNNSGHSS
jgi:hypothetical protein